MKKTNWLDLLFLSLPIISAAIVFASLSSALTSDFTDWEFGIFGMVAMILGAFSIAFNRVFKNLGAWWHSVWHPYFYKQKDSSTHIDSNKINAETERNPSLETSDPASGKPENSGAVSEERAEKSVEFAPTRIKPAFLSGFCWSC